VGDALQRRRDADARGLDHVLALRGAAVGREVQRLVDDAEVVLVVQEAGVGVDLGVDADPELHVALELRRARHDVVRCRASRPRAARERRASGPETGPATANYSMSSSFTPL